MGSSNPARMKKFHLRNGRHLVFLTANDICEICKVSKPTAYKWMSNEIPHPYNELLEFKKLGIIPCLDGCLVVDGELITRNGYKLNLSDLETYGVMMENLDRMARELTEEKEKNRRLMHWLEQKQPGPKPQPIEETKRPWWQRFTG